MRFLTPPAPILLPSSFIFLPYSLSIPLSPFSLMNSSVVRNFAEAPAAGQLTLNFTTPATALHVKKVVDKVIIPGAAGEYGVTAGHSPIISELKAGVVQVVHVGVSSTSSFFYSLLTSSLFLSHIRSFYLFSNNSFRVKSRSIS